MGMSTHVEGFVPADAEWEKMKRIFTSCEAAGVEVPEVVWDYFGGEDPEDKPGMDVDLGDAVKKWAAEMREGYEIDVSMLPSKVRFIRVFNSF